jgi:hypothetical protein
MVIKYQQSSIDLQSQLQSKASVCTAMLVGHSEDRSSMLRLESKSIVDRERLPAATYGIYLTSHNPLKSQATWF